MRNPSRAALAALALMLTVGTLVACGEKAETGKGDKTEESSEKEEDDGAKKPDAPGDASSVAASYLEYGPLSRQGVIGQMMRNQGFSEAEATAAVDGLNADWDEQAALSAEDYLSRDDFTRESMLEQLTVGSGYTDEQAEFGVNAAGL